jgi:hypothetical protein
VSKLGNRWRVFWKDFNSKEDWKFPELPPIQLQMSVGVQRVPIDRSELLRAEWMWARKPKPILGEGGYPLLWLVALVLLLVPHVGILLTIAWSFPVFGSIARDIVRSRRWRRDYEVSVIRILRGKTSFK